MSDFPAQPASHSIDITTANFETEVINASMSGPLLVNFWTPRSEVTLTLGSLLEKIVGAYNGTLKLARINVDSEAQVAAMFGIRSVPTVILIRDGQPVDGFAGSLPEAEIREFLGKHLPPPADNESESIEAPPETPEQAITRLQQALATDPERGELKLDLAVAFMQTGNAKAASAELDALPANLETDDRAKRVRGQLEFAELLQDAPPLSELEARIASNSADFAARDLLGIRLLLAGQTEAGLEQFLEILKADRNWNEGLAKKRLISAFLGIDDADLLGQYRRRMSSLLF